MIQKQAQGLVLDEQLTGLSPTVCRRAIAAIRRENAACPKDSQDLPQYCDFLLDLLGQQIGFPSCSPAHFENYDKRREYLAACTRFLDIVEGKETAAG